ncbi:substrate-binding domain-containing protein [Thioalkalicoccus limnaeus]|uniref:Substrate-binding domain-containing protein n=1 Tax=Thioalkalicoccus limnaeus TaxID=120681 RepID=A0ABV4BBN9_9GAMM
MNKPLIAVTATALAVLLSTPTLARDHIHIVGSSTLYPFAKAVSERFDGTTDFPAPRIDSTGTGGGLTRFCAGVGEDHPDIANASRPIKTSELDTCLANGVDRIIEIRIGFDGIAIANSRAATRLDLSLQEVWMALAKVLPDPAGGDEPIANPYQTWRALRADLPETRIQVLGPPPTSGTRDAFIELAMEPGCDRVAAIAALRGIDKDRHQAFCQEIRDDGAFVEAGEYDDLIWNRLVVDPTAVGIFGFSYLDRNADKIQAARIDGIEPSIATIADGRYPLSRPLYLYVKQAHLDQIPGVEEYLAELTSDAAWGPDGYLAAVGLIPLPESDREAMSERLRGRTGLERSAQ